MTTMPAAIRPLPPALQNSFLLSLHVAVAVFAYGTFTVAFAVALLYLSQSGADANRQELARLDAIGYRAVTLGFPLMALVIILGAYWASIAWGRYWSWDPMETASLVTWLIYGGYLHARGVRGWRGRRAAILLVVGFIATVFTFLGNTFLGGLHSYA
jgi:cytochrome c-type biogenesis protein CcsB